jgi:hypothetical protein
MYARIQHLAKRRLTLIALVAISAGALVSAYAIETHMGFPPYAIVRSQPELLSWDNGYSITSDSGQPNPTILSIVVRNSGTVSVTIATLTIQDLTAGSSSATFPLNGPTIPAPNVTATVTVDTLNSGFYFIHGHSYTFNVITTKQTQFAFGPVSYA